MQKKEESKKEILEEEEKRGREKKAEKVEVETKIPERVEEKVEKITYEEKHLVVPLIKLENVPELQLRKIEVGREVPRIEKRKEAISIPIIEIQEPSPMLRECKLDYKLPSIEKRRRTLTIPIIRVNPPPKISILLTEFDIEIRKPREIILPKIKVPIYWKATLIPLKFLIETFDSTINEQLTMRLERREEIREELLVKEVEKSIKTMMEESPELSEEDVFVPPFLEKLSFATKPIGRPICIVLSKGADDSFVYLVALVCREIYRIVKGGKPEPKWISKGLKEVIEERLRAEGMIFLVDDSKREFFPDFSSIRYCTELLEKIDMEKLFDRLREFFSQDFGFVIFHVNEKWASQFAKILEEKVGAYAKIIYVPSPTWQEQVKVNVAKVFWGFMECEGQTFDEILGQCEQKFFEELEKAKGDIELWHYMEEDKNASKEHEGMKAIVVECLARELGATSKADVIRMLKEKSIRTEYILNSGERVDVYLNTPSIKRFVEIETFYGREDPVIRLDKDTLSKYRGKSINSVDVVLLNGIQALLYAHKLVKLANIYRREYKLKVNFYLPNIKDKKLVPLKDIFHMLRNTIGSSKPTIELTADDIKNLWNEFSKALREYGMNPENANYRRIFNVTIDCSKSYQENLSRILEEVKGIKLLEKSKKDI
jgi:hypothetical protein